MRREGPDFAWPTKIRDGSVAACLRMYPHFTGAPSTRPQNSAQATGGLARREHDPLRGLPVRLAPRRLDAVDEPVEHRSHAGSRDGALGKRAHRDEHCCLRHLDLERDRLRIGRTEHAQHGELELVDLLVRQLDPAADASEHERGDAS